MEGSVKITGLKEAMKAMQAAFPKNPKQQRGLLNSAMRAAAKGTMLSTAKSLALRGDGSGALSESLGIRVQSRAKMRTKALVAAGIELVPIRDNAKAMALYINHYYTARGKTTPAKVVASGIRHGHLVEFGTVKTSARPFLWPAAQAGSAGYITKFSAVLKKKTEAAVRRRAKKAAKK